MNLADQLKGYRLTTLELLYRMPDHPSLLQEFYWQTQDLPPEFPRIKRFLDYWKQEIEAPIHRVRIHYVGLIGAGRLTTKTWVV